MEKEASEGVSEWVGQKQKTENSPVEAWEEVSAIFYFTLSLETLETLLS